MPLTLRSPGWTWAALLVLLVASSWRPLGECGEDGPQLTWLRDSNPDWRGEAPVPHWLRRMLSERLVQLCWLLLLARMWSGASPQLPSAVAQMLLWFPGILFIEWAKLLFDPLCASASGNGISGHYFYYSWALRSLQLLQGPRSPLFLLYVPVFCLEGFFTFYYGYHSLRQCILGAALGSLYASACNAAALAVFPAANED